jgi:phosphatidylglycerol:prolipoprotein diacylglycerol transferase
MFPTLYTMKTAFGDLPYNTWGLTLTLAFFAAAWVVHVRSSRVGIDPDKMVGLYIIAIVAGLAGARLLHFAMAKDTDFWNHPSLYFDFSKGGFAVYGGVILAWAVGKAYGLVRGINVWKMGDVVMPSVLLGQAIGRIGCFFAGCCHGRVADLPASAVALLPEGFSGGQLWFVPGPPFLLELTRHGVGENNVVVLPTQLYEAGVCLLLFALTSWLWRRRIFDGQIEASYFLLYGIWRPINEALRGDSVRGTDWFGSLTTSQVVSIPVVVVGALIVLLRFRKGVAPEAPFVFSDTEISAGSAPRV